MSKKDLSEDISLIESSTSQSDDEVFVRKHSIQQQITGGVALILGIIASVAAIVVFFAGRYYLTSTAGERYEDISHSAVLLMQQSFQTRADYLQQIALNASIQAGIGSSNSTSAKDAIHDILARFSDVEGVWLLNSEGNVMAFNSSKNNETPMEWAGLNQKNYMNDEWFYKCKITKSPHFYPDTADIKTMDTNLAKNLMLWTQPIPGRNGCIVLFSNSILISQDVYRKVTYVKKVLKQKSVQAHIISPEGQVLYSTDSEWSKYVGSQDKFNPLSRHLKISPHGFDQESLNGKSILFAWNNIKENLLAQETLYLNAYVVIQVNMSELSQPLYYLVLMLIGLVFFVTATASYLSYSRSKSLVHFPLMELEDKMEKIAAGDLGIGNIKIQESNDIGFLAFGLNRMIFKFRKMLFLITESGKDVMQQGKRFFINLGNMQTASLKIGNLLKEAVNYLKKITEISDDIYQNAVQQQGLAQTNRNAMDNLQASFEMSGNKRMDITLNARNVVQKSNSGLQTIDDFANNVQKIADSSKQIRGIINMIDDISDQTNLLALNASIEAARAGAHGHGFSVVANEISELAKRSARSAEEITHLIKDTVQQVTVVSDKVDSARNIFKQIADMMHKLDKEIIEMADFTSKQESEVLETAGRAKNVAAFSEKISNNTKTQAELTGTLSRIMSQIEDLSSESRKEIEKDDQLLQVFMNKIKNLMEIAGQFKISNESLDSKENEDENRNPDYIAKKDEVESYSIK